jgi:hypothetical protein
MFDFVSLAEAVTVLATKAIPTDEERLARLQAKYPLLMQRAIKKAEKQKALALKEKLKSLDEIAKFADKNNLSVYDLTMYLSGDTTEAKLVNKILKK